MPNNMQQRGLRNNVLSQLFGNESVVGIDIGSSSIKAIQLEPNGSGWKVVNAVIQQTPPESCRDGVVTMILDVGQTIKSLLKSSGIRCTKAVAAIYGSQVIVRQVQMPVMSEAALRKSIRYEASRYISTSTEDSVVEFEILGNVPDTDQMNVMLVAAPKEVVDSRVQTIEAAGLEPIAIDVESFSIIRSLVDISTDDEVRSKTIAIVDMGASHTDINIVANGEFALTRSIPIAGDSFTNSIRTLTGFSFEDAERMKFEMTAQDSIDKLSSSDGESKSWKVVQPLLDELLREIRRSNQFYQQQFPEGADRATVSNIILTGGTSRMPGMAAYVESKLNIPTCIGDAFSRRINTGRYDQDFVDDYGPVFVVAVGLALKEELAKSKLLKAA